MENKIVIIGTEPPCPRCDYVTRMVQDIVAEMGLDASVRHIAYTGDEARGIAEKCGLLPGTAKDVAKTVAVTVDWDRVYALIGETSPEPDQASCCGTPGQRWSPALDEALRPCEERALEAGIMMTPVLVINGKSVHQGSVPERAQVVQWIKEAFEAASDTGEGRDVVEILGVGCKRCDTLYERVASVITEMGITDRVALKKRSDIGYFAEKGVTMTPGLVINGQVVSMGRLPDSEQLRRDIDKYLDLSGNK